MIPLSMVESGKKVRIIKILGGRGRIKKLLMLGILEGETIQVLSNAGGPLIISRGNARLALGRGISHKILVEEVQ